MRYLKYVVVPLCAATLWSAGAAGQGRTIADPPGADTLSKRAIAESLKVLDRLNSTVRDKPTDAAAWYRRGMVAFALATRASKLDDGAIGLDYNKLRTTGSESLLRATELDSANANYMAALTRFRATDQLMGNRTSGACNADLDYWRTEPDTAIRVKRMLNMAVKCWLDFDGYENRAQSGFVETPTATMSRANAKGVGGAALSAPKSVVDAAHRGAGAAPPQAIMQRAIDTVTMKLIELPFDVAGEADYMRAMTLASEAYRIAPDSERAYQFLAMLALSRDKWADLEAVSAVRVRRDPKDTWAAFALVLARYRLHPSRTKAASFDSLLARLSPAERARLDRFERIMRPSQVPAVQRVDPAAKAQNEKATWLLAQPLWSLETADPRTEFLARVIYADLRWTLPDGSIRGADTDRGDIYIRYGPPNRKLGFADPSGQPVMYEFWLYKSDLMFAFYKSFHTGKAKFMGGDIALFEELKEVEPARWDNIATARIDSMPTQLARFRSGDDSVEAFFSTRAPMETLALSGVGNVASVAHFWLYGLDSPTAIVDSLPLGKTGRVQWTRRIGAGSYYYRLESVIPGTLVASRASAGMTMGHDPSSGFAMRGFGLSDVLLSTKITATSARRWNDFQPEPVLGAVPPGAEIGLVWETYEIGQSDGSARYEVAVSIERVRSRAGRIAAEIVNRTAAAIGIDRSDDKLAMKFEREVPYAATIADNININLGDTPLGTYLLTVQVTDRVSKRTASRTINLTISDK